MQRQQWSRWRRDPLAWHGGLRVREGGIGKWILQKFKELPTEHRGDECELPPAMPTSTHTADPVATGAARGTSALDDIDD